MQCVQYSQLADAKPASIEAQGCFHSQTNICNCVATPHTSRLLFTLLCACGAFGVLLGQWLCNALGVLGSVNTHHPCH